MTNRAALSEGAQVLRKSVGSPYLDSVLLLGHAYGISKERLLSSLPDEIPVRIENEFRSLIKKRNRGVPVSYIRRCKEFFSLDFYVDHRVLVPRPETEVLVETALAVIERDSSVAKVHDSCTGSGCIAIALKAEQPFLQVSASDICSDALNVFEKNSLSILGSTLPHTSSDLLSSVFDIFDMIVANPPYVKTETAHTLAASGWVEPMLALDGGADGLGLLSNLVGQAKHALRSGGYLILEADPDQMEPLKKICVQSGFNDIILYEDFSGRNRVLQSRRIEH